MTDISTKDLSKMLDLTPQRLGQLAKADVLVKKGRGMYDLAASVRGYVEFLRDGESDGLSPAQERALLHRAQRKRIEFEMRQAKGELVEIDVALKSYADATGVAKKHLFAIPQALSPYLVGKAEPEIYSQLTDAIYHALETVSKIEEHDDHIEG